MTIVLSCGRVGGCQKQKPADFVWSSTHSPSDFHLNYGYESLAYDSVRHLLWSISESTLRNDGEPASWQNGEANRLPPVWRRLERAFRHFFHVWFRQASYSSFMQLTGWMPLRFASGLRPMPWG